MRGFLVFISLTLAIPSAGQFHTIFNFSVPEGLPSSEVYEVYQDKKGFLWFATDNGVARYDGRQFESFNVKEGLTDPVVFGFFEDDKDRVWFRTFSGKLCYLNGDKIEKYPYNDQLIRTGRYPFFNFVYDSISDALLFSLADVFGRIDETGQLYTENGPAHSSWIRSVNGRLLQGTDIRTAVRNIIINDQVFPVRRTDTLEYKYFNTIACGGKIYVSLYKDLYEYYEGTVKKIVTSNHPIISLSKDRDEELWVGYLNHGVTHYVQGEPEWTPEFLKNRSVTKVFHDESDGFWFTTLESGVYHVPSFKIRNYTLPTVSRIKTVLSLKDTVLIGDQRGNLFFLDADSRRLLSTIRYPDEVYALFRDSFKNIWVSAGVDIICYDPGFRKKIVHRGNVATSFSQGPRDYVWAYGGIRISQFDKDGKFLKFETRSINYRTMLVDDSIIYFGGRTGLDVRDFEMDLVGAPKQFAEYKITQMESFNDTTLVLATQGNGLVIVNKKDWSYRQFDMTHQFLANNIYCLAIADSTLWMGTEKGLIATSIKRLLRNDIRFYHYSKRSGLVSDQINFVLPVKETVWAFSDNGYSIIPRSLATSPSTEPIIYIKTIIAGDDTLNTTKELSAGILTLPNDNNHLTVTFGCISFSSQSTFLRYRISPDREWINTTAMTLQFLSLAPGDYAFELQYSVDNVVWYTPLKPLQFTVDSPWWMKWYTMVGALAITVLFGSVYFHYRQSIYKQKNHYLNIINSHQQKLLLSEVETLERERKRIAQELHDGVGTNLTAIKLMVNQLLQHYHAPQAVDVEEQFQIALRELKDIIYGLTPPSLARYGLFTALKNYVAKLNKSLSPEISLEIFGQEVRNYEFNIMVFRIVQELISNSIKHSSASHITIHINSFEDMLNIVYEDDGVGFTYSAEREGLGLDNIESRIQSMNGSLTFASGAHGISYTIDIPLRSIRETA